MYKICHDGQIKSFYNVPSIFHMEKENIYFKRFFFTKFAQHQFYIPAKGFHP